MTDTEKAQRFDTIRAQAHALAAQALARGDESALLVFRLTQRSLTAAQVRAQRERLKAQTRVS